MMLRIKTSLMAAAAMAAMGICGVAEAATFVTVTAPSVDGSLSWDFGNTGGVAAGAFTDIFNFVIPTAGTLSGSLQSTYTGSTNKLTFTLATVNLSPLTLYNFPGLYAGSIAFLPAASGPSQIVVKGVSPGVAGSYTGHLSFTPNAVPEPTTWALMIVGFGGAGTMLRRRRREGVALA